MKVTFSGCDRFPTHILYFLVLLSLYWVEEMESVDSLFTIKIGSVFSISSSSE